MMLPLTIIRGLKMPWSRKLSLGILFGLGVLCIIASTIRTVKIAGDANDLLPTLWIAQWNIIESSVAVIVGCGPGLYRKAKSVNKTHGKYSLEAGQCTKKHDGSHSAGGRSINSRRQCSVGNEIPLEAFPVTTIRASEGVHAEGSKEGLVTKDSEGLIMVTTSVRISRIQRG